MTRAAPGELGDVVRDAPRVLLRPSGVGGPSEVVLVREPGRFRAFVKQTPFDVFAELTLKGGLPDLVAGQWDNDLVLRLGDDSSLRVAVSSIELPALQQFLAAAPAATARAATVDLVDQPCAAPGAAEAERGKGLFDRTDPNVLRQHKRWYDLVRLLIKLAEETESDARRAELSEEIATLYEEKFSNRKEAARWRLAPNATLAERASGSGRPARTAPTSPEPAATVNDGSRVSRTGWIVLALIVVAVTAALLAR